MKNILKTFCVFTVLVAAMSCNEKIEVDLNDAQNYITITSEVAPQVKAGYEGTTVLPSSFYIDIRHNSEVVYQGLVERNQADGNSNRYYFPEGENPQWRSVNLSNISIKAITESSGYTHTASTVTINENQSSEDAIKENDLLGASYNDGITVNANNINVTFKHLMSKLYIKYNKSSSIEIKSISLKNICTKGGYSFEAMNYANDVTLGYGNIDMFHNAATQEAEAIFYPYTATSAPSLNVVTTDGKEIPCPISLDKIGGKFVAGKRYIMNIVISGSSIEGAEITMVKNWNPDSNSIKVTGERVLWVGTSIPAGNALLNYPMLVDYAMNCTVINKAVGGSVVSTSTDKAAAKTMAQWDDYNNSTNTGPYSGVHLEYGALSQTRAEIESTYTSTLQSAYTKVNPEPSRGKQSWREKRNAWVKIHLDKLKELSYESLIMDYIDGTKDNCTTVIIDHGYNDLGNMIFLGGAFPTTEGQVRGYDHLMDLKNQKITLSDYQKVVDGNVNTNGQGRNYIQSMAKIIDAIQTKYPNVRIIIGNYFAFNSPYVTNMFKAQHETPGTNAYQQFPDYAKFTNLICHSNEAIAGYYDLGIVNVYKYLSIDDSMFYNPDHCTAPNDLDYSKFCPDGVHPSNPSAVRAIADVYISELDGVVGSKE